MPDPGAGRINARLQSELDELRARSQWRELTTLRGIDLCSNDYLGLSSDPRLRKALAAAVRDDDRLASTGSRLLSGNHVRWEELEAEFARFVGAEASVFFTSGYLANVGLLSALLRPEDTVFSDASNHASLIDGIRLSRARKVVFPHLDLNHLETCLKTAHGASDRFVVLEGIFSMDGDHAPIGAVIDLCNRYDATLIVDEAHSTGVDGPGGRGIVAAAGRPRCVLATIHTCGKALASMGAFVAGSRALCDFLINRARTFIFSTALPPYCAGQIRTAIGLAREAEDKRAHLADVASGLRARLRQEGFDTGRSDSQILPVILGSNEAALGTVASLVASGFAVRAIRPPTVPVGSARLRLSLTATIGAGQVDALVAALIRERKARAVRE